MITKNFHQLQAEVAAHVIADRVKQGSYRTCFIGCLANGVDNPAYIEREYGIPRMVSRLAESIFEALPTDEAPSLFAALPAAIGCNGKNLTLLGWQFLAAELRSLPPVPADVQAAIDPVIAGMDLLSEGKEWPSEAAWAADAAVRDIRDTDAADAADAVGAVRAAIDAAVDAASAAKAADAKAADAKAADASASWAAANAADMVAWAARFADALNPKIAARRRQKDTLLQLIKEAPVTQEATHD
jgi:hypothetical protein